MFASLPKLGVLWIAVICVGGNCAEEVQAGCHLNPTEGQVFEASSTRIALHHPWSQAKLVRIYTDGKFIYFQANDNPVVPCDGPQCRNRDEKSSIAVIPHVESSRQPLKHFSDTTTWMLGQEHSERVALQIATVTEGIPQDLLRPPCPAT